MRWLQSVLAVVAVLFVSSPAIAVPVVLFEDDFESQPAANVSHAAYPDPTVAADPSAPSVGTWVTVDVGPEGQDVQVTDYATPGAAAGNNYLRLHGRTLTSYVEAIFAEQSTVGDVVRVEMDFYNPSEKGFFSPYIAAFSAVGHREREWTVVGDTREGDEYGPYDTYDSETELTTPIPGISFIDDVWTHLQFDWRLGDATMVMKLGEQSATVPVDTNNNAKIGQVWIIGGYFDGDLSYFDNVKVTLNPHPDPSTLMPGDANGNGQVNEADAAILANNWLATGDWWCGDFNDDGIVDDKDATLLAANWTGAAAQAQVPEPSAGLMIILGILSLLGIVRRK